MERLARQPNPMTEPNLQICTRCVMDSTDPDIQFDADGICNHCKHYDSVRPFFGDKKAELQTLVDKISAAGKNNDYDCVIGLSGGVDSTYVAYRAVKMGLRPLAVHLDNGWNSEIAVRNIENIVKKLDIDLHTHVIDWEEFRDLQLSFFKASVVDIEMLTDHAIGAVILDVATSKKIKWMISGTNLATEAILPRSWYHSKSDLKNILAIHKKFGTRKLKTFPMASGFKRKYFYTKIKKIQELRFLNYIHYDKAEAMETIKKELAWQDYGSKHGESVFTKFYQNYILPRKFNLDKRKAHLSCLICSGQISRAEALLRLEQPLYAPMDLKRDSIFAMKKLGFSESEFEAYLNAPPQSHFDYASENGLRRFLSRVKKKLLGNS